MPTYKFRLPQITVKLSPTFGLPRQTFGRGIYTPQAIVLHTLRTTLQDYTSQVTQVGIRTQAEIRHPSVHFAVGLAGETHQYVSVQDVAWAMWDYQMSNFPVAFAHGSWNDANLFPTDVTPDYYAIHIATCSGEDGTPEFTTASMISVARLIAYYSHYYDIPNEPTHVFSHDKIDLQFAHTCVSDAYPYNDITDLAETLILQGGELDRVFDFPYGFNPDEYTGPWTVGLSRVGSLAYITGEFSAPHYADGEIG